MKSVMIIPVINHATWMLREGINQYSYKPDEIHELPNSVLNYPDSHVPQGGSRKIIYAFETFKPDILIYHASDWLLERDGLRQIMRAIESYMEDSKIISAGINPWTMNGGSWHECSFNEEAQACQYVVAYRKEIMIYVKPLVEAKSTKEILNEACYYATKDGWSVSPVYIEAMHIGKH